MKFSELFEGATSRSEVVVTFLALLELIRLKQIVCRASRSLRRNRDRASGRPARADGTPSREATRSLYAAGNRSRPESASEP